MKAFPPRVVLATGNPGKRADLTALLAGVGVTVLESALPSPEEDGATYTANARLKALAASRATGLPALGDDVGIEVDALDGVPGLHTRRWAEANGGFDAATRLLCRTCAGSRAVFHCALVLVTPDGEEVVGQGVVEGIIRQAPVAGPGLEGAFLGSEHHRERAFASLFSQRGSGRQ